MSKCDRRWFDTGYIMLIDFNAVSASSRCFLSVSMAPWCSGLTCHPVTVEIVGSNPIGVANTYEIGQEN